MKNSTHRILLASVAMAMLAISGCTDLTPCARGTEGCACKLNVPVGSACDAVTDGTAVCAAGTCVVQRTAGETTVCYDACAYRQDGVCDDGGPNSVHSDCHFGSDCSDCGVRTNPCAGTATPLFCPQTPNNCWPSNIDCLSTRYCNSLVPAMRGPFACPQGEIVDCNALGGPRCVSTTPCSDPSFTRCSVEMSCVAPYIDCNSLTLCNGQTVGCYTGETVSCMTGQPAACTPAP